MGSGWALALVGLLTTASGAQAESPAPDGGAELGHRPRSDEIPVADESSQEGLYVQTAEGRLRLRLGPEVMAESQSFFGPTQPGLSGLRVRGGVQFSLKAFDLFGIEFWPFYGGSGLSLRDFYGSFEPSPVFRLQFGRFREPVSYERTQSLDYLPFFQRSLVRNLAPGRDIGLQASGVLLGGALSYAAFLGNGLLDGQSSATNTGPGLDVAGRLVLQLHGLGLGVGASYGPRADALGAVAYSTSGGTRFLQFASGAEAVDDQARLSPFLFWLLGPVGLRGEYLRSSQTVRVGARSARAHEQAWFAEGKVVLTGEKATQVGVAPRGGFAPFQGRLGACLLALRYSELWVDPDLLAAGLVQAEHTATLARAAALSLEDYVSPLSKVQLSYEQSWLLGQGGLAGQQEHALFVRIQLEW